MSDLIQRLQSAGKDYDREWGTGADNLYREAADALDALASRLERDAERLNWLETQYIEVRRPARYGSRPCFIASCGEENEPSDVRVKIDSALALRATEQQQQGKP